MTTRMGLRIRHLDPVETGRYTSEDGTNTIVTTSALADLTLRRGAPAYINGKSYSLWEASQGEEKFWVATLDGMDGLMKIAGQSVTREGKTTTYQPAKEWHHASGAYATEEDLRAALGDKGERETRTQKVNDMLQRARESAGGTWSREGYESACRAVDLEPLQDTEVGIHNGVYSVGEYTVEHIVLTRLAGSRAAEMKRERERRDTSGLAAAEAAVGTGPYSREEYEQACASANVPALTDRGCWSATESHLSDLAGGIRVIIPGGRELSEGELRLAMRRADGLMQETAEDPTRVCSRPGCNTIIPAGTGMNASLGLVCSIDCYDEMSG